MRLTQILPIIGDVIVWSRVLTLSAAGHSWSFTAHSIVALCKQEEITSIEASVTGYGMVANMVANILSMLSQA